MIIGLDLLCELDLIINCEEKVVEWQDSNIPMIIPVTKFNNKKQLRVVLQSTKEPESTKSERSRLVKILDTDYKPADIDDIVITEDDLNEEQKEFPRNLLNKYIILLMAVQEILMFLLLNQISARQSTTRRG